MKMIYTQFLTKREVRFTTSTKFEPSQFDPNGTPDYLRPRVEILSNGRVWFYHKLDGVWAWSLAGSLDEAMCRMVKEKP